MNGDINLRNFRIRDHQFQPAHLTVFKEIIDTTQGHSPVEATRTTHIQALSPFLDDSARANHHQQAHSATGVFLPVIA